MTQDLESLVTALAAGTGLYRQPPADMASEYETDAGTAQSGYSAAMLWGDDILSLPSPTPLVTDVLDRGHLTLLAGPSGAGKSFVALSLAASVAAGTPWFGRETPEALPAIYIAAEGAYGIGQRLRAWSAHAGRPIPPRLGVLGEAVPLRERARAEEFAALAIEYQPGLIVFDTLARVATGWDENHASDMSALTEVAASLARETGASVLFVHHTNKGGGIRGSSALFANSDSVLRVGKTDTPGELDLFRTKRKDGPPELDMAFALSVPDDSAAPVLIARETAAEEPIGPDHRARVFRELFQAFGDDAVSRSRMVPILVDAFDTSPRTAHRRITALADDGALTRTGRARDVRYACDRAGAERAYGERLVKGYMFGLEPVADA